MSRPSPLFYTQARSRAVCFVIGRVDHRGATFGLSGGQDLHHSDEDASVAPSLPTIVQCLVRPIGRWRITLAQAIAIDENDPAQHPAIIHAWPAVALGKIGFQPSHLLVRQPAQAAHIQNPQEPESDGAPQINDS